MWSNAATSLLSRKLAIGDLTPTQTVRAKEALLGLRQAPSPMAYMSFLSAITSTPLCMDPEWFAVLKLDEERFGDSMMGRQLANTTRRIERLRSALSEKR